MDQAVLVAIKQEYDPEAVQDWCDREGDKAKKAYVDFIRIFNKSD